MAKRVIDNLTELSVIRGQINDNFTELYASSGGKLLTIAGSDVAAAFAEKCNLLLTGTGDNIAINEFLDDYTDGIYTVKFFGTINGSGYLYKRLNHNWDGYCAVIKMLPDLLSADYIAGILPLSGDHKYTYIKGFELDGNIDNNDEIVGNVYSCGLTYDIYDSFTPTARTIAYNIICEDIYSHDWLRSCFLPGPGWVCNNIKLENSKGDHLLYISGAGNITMNNVYLSGYCNGTGALHISGSNPLLSPLAPENITINNLTFDEVVTTEGTHLHIRGTFLSNGEMVMPCKNVNIRNVYIKNSTPHYGNIIAVGHQWDTGGAGGLCENINIEGINVDLPLNPQGWNYAFGYIMRARNVKISGNFNLKDNDAAKTVFELLGGGIGRNNYDFSGCDFLIENYTNLGINCAAFGIKDDQDIVGINISNVKITGADVFRRVTGTTAKIINLNKTGAVCNKIYNPDSIVVETTNEI